MTLDPISFYYYYGSGDLNGWTIRVFFYSALWLASILV